MQRPPLNFEKIIAELLLLIARQQEKTMSQLDDLTAAVAQATTDFQTYQTDVTAKLTDLQAQIAALQAANPAVDLTGVTAAVTALDGAIKGADSAVTPAAPAA